MDESFSAKILLIGWCVRNRVALLWVSLQYVLTCVVVSRVLFKNRLFRIFYSNSDSSVSYVLKRSWNSFCHNGRRGVSFTSVRGVQVYVDRTPRSITKIQSWRPRYGEGDGIRVGFRFFSQNKCCASWRPV